MDKLRIETRKAKEVLDVTNEVNALLAQSNRREGLCHLFLLHTTAALTTADLDPGTDQDMLDALAAMAPRLRYRHPHDPEHAPDHILSSLIGPALTVPVRNGYLVLGTWQRVVLVELSGPRPREICVSFLPTD